MDEIWYHIQQAIKISKLKEICGDLGGVPRFAANC